MAGRGFHSDNFWVNKNYDAKMKARTMEQPKAPKNYFVISPETYIQMHDYIKNLKDAKDTAGFASRTFKVKNEIEIIRMDKDENYDWCISLLNDLVSVEGSDVRLYRKGEHFAVLEICNKDGKTNGTIEMELKGSRRSFDELP